MSPISTLDTDALQAGLRVTWAGTILDALLIGCKLAAGLLGHSQALIADAVHSLSDLFTDLVVLFGLRAGRKAPDASHHFGHGRIETITSAIVGFALIIVAVLIGYKAALSIYHHTVSHPTWLALGGAGFSIAAKEILYRYTVKVGRRIKSQTIIANAWNHRSDAFSSVAVLLGVGGTLINPAWHLLDAYASLVVSFLVFWVGLGISWDSFKELTDTAPGPEFLNKLQVCLRSVPGVLYDHDLKVRSVGGIHQMQIHIVVDGELSVFEGHRIAKEVERCLKSEFDDMGEVIVHVDPADPKGMNAPQPSEG